MRALVEVGLPSRHTRGVGRGSVKKEDARVRGSQRALDRLEPLA